MINNILMEVLATMIEAKRDKIKSRQSSGITAVKAMELPGLKKNTFYNLVKKYKEK